MQVYNVCLRLEDQMGTQCTYNGPIVWGYNACTKGNAMHAQRTNPIGHDVHMYRGPILWDSACS